jgi:hypothetical protein
VPCGYRYQEAPQQGLSGPLPACRCGTFAIGSCSVCSAAVCGLHSSLVNDLRTCSSCIKDVADREREAVASARAAALAELQAVADPIERLLRTKVYLSGRPQAEAEDFYVVCPEYDQSGPWGYMGQTVRGLPPGERVPWDSAAVARWFVDQAAQRGLHPPSALEISTERLSPLNKLRGRPGRFWAVANSYPAWFFGGGSTTDIPQRAKDIGPTKVRDAWILLDGRVLAPVTTEWRVRGKDGGDVYPTTDVVPTGLGARAVLQIAQLLGLDQMPSSGDAHKSDGAP